MSARIALLFQACLRNARQAYVPCVRRSRRTMEKTKPRWCTCRFKVSA